MRFGIGRGQGIGGAGWLAPRLRRKVGAAGGSAGDTVARDAQNVQRPAGYRLRAFVVWSGLRSIVS